MLRLQAAALSALLAAAPACIIAPKNQATTEDVVKPPSDPPIPESRFVTVEYTESGLTEPVYEAPADHAFVIRDLRLSEACDVFVELSGVPATMQLPALFLEPFTSAPYRWRFLSTAGLKLPGGAKLRLRAAGGTDPVPVLAFVAGDLVRR